MEILSNQTSRFSLAPLARPSVSSGKKTIFLVQSAPRPASPIRAALEEEGYEVIPSDSVDAALRMWMRLDKPVDLFLADITLGRDPGVEQLVRFLHAENPRMRVLYANDLEVTVPMVPQSYPRQLIAVIENCLA